VAYDGHNYRGFQLQTSDNNNDPCQKTVQGVLEDVLNRRFVGCSGSGNANVSDEEEEDSSPLPSQQPQRIIKVIGAGRTDAGVHARGQAIHFDLPETVARSILDDPTTNVDGSGRTASSSSIEASLNAMLPSDVRIWNLQKAPESINQSIIRRRQKQIDHRSVTVNPTSRTGDTGNTEEQPETRMVAQDVHGAFHVIYDATRKWYSYRLALGPIMDPMQRHCRWHRHHPRNKRRRRKHQPQPPQDANHSRIDPEYLQRILRFYEGTHDFRAFAGAMERNQRKKANIQSREDDDDENAMSQNNTVRTVHSVRLVLENPIEEWYRIDFILQGALYKQVRNMVGTAMDVVLGNLSESDFLQLLSLQSPENEEKEVNNGHYSLDESFNSQPSFYKRKTRCHNPSKPAPPHGLTLEYVYFDNHHDPNF
jgi:tRNA pseudouridine38-40 synthase